MGNNKKVTVKVKTEAKRGKAIKPTLGRGSGGLLSARIAATVKNEKK